MVPNLEFGYFGGIDFQTFSDYVCRYLLSHQAPFLQRLHLNVVYESSSYMDLGLGVLLEIEFGLHLREFKLQVSYGGGRFPFPRSLYNCETLETLELVASFGSILAHVPSPVCLKSLRTLHLHEVDFKDVESARNLLAGCPSLENLVVERDAYNFLETFTIAVPSLQRLTVIDYGFRPVYVINAPSLKYFKIKGTYGRWSCLIENAPELMEANINFSDVIFSENIMGSLASVKRLSLRVSPLEIPFPTGNIFYQLAYLEICTYISDWLNLLTVMLDSSPSLQVLKLIGFSIEWSDKYKDWPCGKWIQPKNVPECLLLHLETFVWACCEGISEDEKEVAKYILRNARHLKKATFSKIDIDSQEWRVKMVKELESMVRASNSCQLVFE